mgnify:CR=1 FL=1
MNKNKKIILIITFILVILLLLVGVYLYKSNRKKDYYLNIDIESNNNVNNPINYEEVINSSTMCFNGLWLTIWEKNIIIKILKVSWK